VITPVLELDQVSVRLAGRTVLDRVSLAVGAGELTGVVGANGAGKTTLVRVILGLLAPSGGRVLLGGEPRGRRTSGVGYVPQRVVVDPDLPLRACDLVGLGIDGHRFGLPRPSKARRDRVEQLLAAVRAEAFARTRVGHLSGGELQRVLVAHALASDPKLLVLDEPLANLDIGAEHEVVTLLAQVAREQQVAVLVSAHDLNSLLPVMDRVVYLAGGRAATGTTDEVVQSEVLTRLYGRPVSVIRAQGRLLVVAGDADVVAGDAEVVAGDAGVVEPPGTVPRRYGQ
jgi:zinc/manganese transport system ATP-binding protein